MNDDLSSKTVLVLDHGLFLPLARRLAKDFGRVLYHTPYLESFPTFNKASIGRGFGDIERCDQPWLEAPDLVVSPDVYFGDWQIEFERRGIPVWGARTGEEFELDRELFLAVLRESGLDVPPHVVVNGWSELADELKTREDCYIKLSRWRGTMETTHWRSWALDADWLYALAVKLGPLKETLQFIVCDSIKTDIELGGDTYCVDGQWPEWMLHGTEAKDKAYFGAVTKQDQMPDALQTVMETFGPLLADHHYRNQWSMEIRVAGEKAYFIDPTCRSSSPATASQLSLWENFSEIVWRGAVSGELVDPKPTAMFSAEVAVSRKGNGKDWTSVEIPEELQDFLFPSACCMDGERVCFPPDPTDDSKFAGWLLATGDTPKETIETLKERVSLLPDGLCAAIEAMAEVIQEIEAEETEGIQFTDQKMPQPESVLSDE
jgi:hypothetical protein